VAAFLFPHGANQRATKAGSPLASTAGAPAGRRATGSDLAISGSAINLPWPGPCRLPARAKLARRPWWQPGRSSSTGHAGGSRRVYSPLVPSPPTAPSGLQLPAPSPSSRTMLPASNSPPPFPSPCAPCLNGPHRGQGWQRARAAGGGAGEATIFGFVSPKSL
jgi:hypothetical protein